ncbi:MAG: hypothetical protein CMF87_02835 [Candidatus Marinimicrobia bacterium]|nr:hypothetical protein [Candidatus Neomarinimicrobiota bacterium]
MIEQLKFIIKESVKSLQRFPIYSFISSLTIMICLIIISFVIYLSDVTNNISKNFKNNESVLKVFLKNDIDVKSSLELCQSIKEEHKFTQMTFEDRNDLFSKIDINLKTWLEDDLEIIPCLCTFSVNVNSVNQIDDLSNSILSKHQSKIDKIVYPRSYLFKFEKILSLTYSVIFLIGIIVFIVSIYNISNIIKLSIESRKNVINILQLHGASKTFIKSPYILEGIMHGFIGFVLSSSFIVFSFNIFSSVSYDHFLAQSLITSITLKTYILINLIFGVILGFVGSNLGTSNYLE